MTAARTVPGEAMELTVDTGEATRSNMWMDDLVTTVTHPPPPPLSLPPDALKKQHICKAFRSGLEFCFTGKVAPDGQDLTSWGKVRKALQTNLVRAHAGAFVQLGAAGGAAANDRASTDVAGVMLGTVGDTPTKQLGVKLNDVEDCMAGAIQHGRFVLDRNAFVHANNVALHIIRQPAYLDVSQQVQRRILQEVKQHAHTKGALTLPAILQH